MFKFIWSFIKDARRPSTPPKRVNLYFTHFRDHTHHYRESTQTEFIELVKEKALEWGFVFDRMEVI